MKTLEITSYIGCPNGCSYCPQALLLREYKGIDKMTFEGFTKILDNVPTDVKIDFSGFSEIFVHPLGSEMIRLAYERKHLVTLYTTLVGITSRDLDVLTGVKFEEVVFHLFEGADSREFTENVKIFYNRIQPGRIATVRKYSRWSRAGNVFDRDRSLGSFICDPAGRDFNHNVVLPNGDVYICCMDYGLKHNMGNLFTTGYDELDREKLVKMSLQRNSDIICRKCELIKI